MNKENNKYILCLNGGGIKGVCFLGALSALKELKLYDKIKILCGTSVGSLILFNLLMDYSIDDLYYFVNIFDFNCFNNLSIDNLLIKYGLNNGNIINELLKQFLNKKKLSENITFKEFYEYNNKLFIVTGTNLNKRTGEFFSYLTTPDMLIVEAVRISTALPFVFTPVIKNNDYYVDGSFFNDLPIKCLFQEPFITYIINNLNIETLNIYKYILGLYLDDKIEINNIKDYTLNLLYTLMVENNKDDMKYCDVIKINTDNIKSYDFNLSKEEIEKMYQNGYNQVKKFYK